MIRNDICERLTHECISYLSKLSDLENFKHKFIICKMRDLCCYNNGMKHSKGVFGYLGNIYIIR
jgi:hypothetical protein